MDERLPAPDARGRGLAVESRLAHPWLTEQLVALGLRDTSVPDLAGWRAFLARIDHGWSGLGERRTGRLHTPGVDDLTLLPDRDGILAELSDALAAVDGQGAVGVLYVDLDRFKLVNDSLGTAAGDRVLLEAVQRLRSCLRVVDAVARIRGDEFAVLLPAVAGVEEIDRIGRRVVLALRRPFIDDGEELHLSASVGSAWSQDPTDAAVALLRDAELAMHRAKESGGDQHRSYDRTLRDRVTSRVRLESRLRHALERDELSLAYQPIFNIPDRSLSGFEALLRWTPADGPPVSPAEFVPIAEDTGLIIPLGAWVLDRAVRTVAGWNRERADEPLRISVNVSGRQLATPGLTGLVARSLHEHRLDRGCLTLEMTESVLIADPDRVLLRLEVLRDLGARISVDDFGTGYSSLAYLRRFPLDALKIDREFTRTLVEDAHGRTITQAIIALGHALGYDVVAEGVEEESQMSVLSEMGCDLVQGFLLGRPLDEATAQRLAVGVGPRPS
jgi:diguanylate cyclase (GGDEF)-like protein